MPGSTPATSQLDWLSSTTAMIVLSWSKATRDLLKSFSWGIQGTPSVICQRRWCHLLAACPIPSLGPPRAKHCGKEPRGSEPVARVGTGENGLAGGANGIRTPGPEAEGSLSFAYESVRRAV